jgi:NAD(P)-dependent dehydrogenase (short-subunit alcohol dehydrogenase family)
VKEEIMVDDVDYSLRPYSLEGQVAVITGAGSGIGRATAKLFAGAGAAVAVTDINLESAMTVAGEIEAAGGRALAVKCDVAEESDVKAMFETAEAKLGAATILICVAAYRKKHHSMTMSVAEWDVMHAVIARGTYLCVREAGARMKRAGRGGAIVSVSSVAAVRPVVLDSIDYDSAKAGVNAITRAAALEFAKDGIRVNAIMPGGTKRPGAPKLHDIEITGPITQPGRILMGRAAEPIEQARAVLFLASPAASYITGQILAVDGGALLS